MIRDDAGRHGDLGPNQRDATGSRRKGGGGSGGSRRSEKVVVNQGVLRSDEKEGGF